MKAPKVKTENIITLKTGIVCEIRKVTEKYILYRSIGFLSSARIKKEEFDMYINKSDLMRLYK